MMKTIIKLIGISLFLHPSLRVSNKIISSEIVYTQHTEKDTTQSIAYQILSRKCNVCHQKQNKRRVFTKTNIDMWSEDIYKQLFIKKRMPKGKKIRLTDDEYRNLLTWIKSSKNI